MIESVKPVGWSFSVDEEGHRTWELLAPPGSFLPGTYHPEDVWAWCQAEEPVRPGVSRFRFGTRPLLEKGKAL